MVSVLVISKLCYNPRGQGLEFGYETLSCQQAQALTGQVGGLLTFKATEDFRFETEVQIKGFEATS